MSLVLSGQVAQEGQVALGSRRLKSIDRTHVCRARVRVCACHLRLGPQDRLRLGPQGPDPSTYAPGPAWSFCGYRSVCRPSAEQCRSSAQTKPGSTQPGSTQPGSTQPGSTQAGSTQAVSSLCRPYRRRLRRCAFRPLSTCVDPLCRCAEEGVPVTKGAVPGHVDHTTKKLQ